MKIRPLDDRVVVKVLDAEEKSDGGIVLPDTAKEKPSRGEVVAIGVGRLLESGDRAPMSVSKGDTVLFGRYSGNEIKISGKEHNVMRETEVLAIIVN
ncbi:MAG: co-chaperone GroES [Planctomycetota bacterium]|nr:co-chaperone GroES [Planctomycetota bacterium]